MAARDVTYKVVSLHEVHSVARLPVQEPHELWHEIQSVLVVTLLYDLNVPAGQAYSHFLVDWT